MTSGSRHCDTVAALGQPMEAIYAYLEAYIIILYRNRETVLTASVCTDIRGFLGVSGSKFFPQDFPNSPW